MIEDRLLGLPQVEEYVHFKRTKIRELMAKGEFPKPLKFGKSAAWKMSQIQDWIASQETQDWIASQGEEAA